MLIEDGFAGQRMRVLPDSLIDDALASPGTSHLTVTGGGFFPQAHAHGMSRPTGIDDAVILTCVAGQGWCRVGGVHHSVVAGQVAVLPPNVPHSYGASSKNPWTIWWLHVRGRDLKDFLRVSEMGVERPVRQLSETFRVVNLMEEVTDRMERDTLPSTLLAASGAAWHLMATVASNLPAGVARTSVIERATEIMRTNLAEQHSVSDLASALSLSSSHFATLFRKQVGTSVLKYQTQLRMAKARELLDMTDWPVSQVAAAVGYADPFYFSRQFKAVNGKTPLKYRSLLKG